MTAASNTLRLAIGNSLDTVFVWSVPLGGKKAYSDGTCPATLNATLTRDTGSHYGAPPAIPETARPLVLGAPGGAAAPAAVLVADIGPLKAAAAAAAPPPSPLQSSTQASAINLDNQYYLQNPSTVIVSARRGTVGVPASQPFSLASWAQGSPGGAPYSASTATYSISPQNPYMSGGKSTQGTLIGLTSALSGLGLTTAALRGALLAKAG